MNSSRRSLVHTPAALLGAVLGIAVLVWPGALASPADAATCADTGGVSVVSDPASLGGPIATACAADGAGKPASTVFPRAGFTLGYYGQGFVCQVRSQPGTCTEPQDDSYWSLWWSDGTSGTWTYSSVGVTGLKVPAGGSIAWRFSTGEKTPPGIPAPRTSTSTGGSGGSGGSGGTSGSGGSGGTAASPGSGAAGTTPGTGSSPSASPSATPSPSEDPTADDEAASGRERRAGSRDGGSGADRTDDSERGDRADRERDGRAGTGARDKGPGGSGDDEILAGERADVVEEADPQAGTVAADGGLPVWVAPAALAAVALLGGGVVGVRRLRAGRP